MIFAFVDESGKLAPKHDSFRPTLTAVAIDQDYIPDIVRRLHSIEIDCFGNDPDQKRKLKGKNMINKNVMTKYNNRKEYVEKLVELLESFDAGVFSIVMEKPDFVPYKEPGLLAIQDQYLLQRLNAFGESKRTEVLFIYDKIDESSSGSGHDGDMANSFIRYLNLSPSGQQLNNIIPMPLFVASNTHNMIRFPDLIGNIIRKVFELGINNRQPGDEYERWLDYLFGIIKKQSVDQRDKRGTVHRAIYEMPKAKFSSSPDDLMEKRKTRTRINLRYR
jgi:hypothetical protein